MTDDQLFEYIHKRSLDILRERERARNILSERGINAPVDPHPENRMQCAPDVKPMLEAMVEGLEMGEIASEQLDRFRDISRAGDQLSDAAFFSIAKMGAQLIIDTVRIQQCMDHQDEVYQKEMEEYEQQIRMVEIELSHGDVDNLDFHHYMVGKSIIHPLDSSITVTIHTEEMASRVTSQYPEYSKNLECLKDWQRIGMPKRPEPPSHQEELTRRLNAPVTPQFNANPPKVHHGFTCTYNNRGGHNVGFRFNHRY